MWNRRFSLSEYDFIAWTVTSNQITVCNTVVLKGSKIFCDTFVYCAKLSICADSCADECILLHRCMTDLHVLCQIVLAKSKPSRLRPRDSFQIKTYEGKIWGIWILFSDNCGILTLVLSQYIRVTDDIWQWQTDRQTDETTHYDKWAWRNFGMELQLLAKTRISKSNLPLIIIIIMIIIG